MPWFLLGVVLVWSAVVLPAVGIDSSMRRDGTLVSHYIVTAWAIPIICAWIAAELVNFVLPKRVLTRFASTRPRRVVAGLFAGGIGAGGAVVAMAYAPEPVPEAVVTGAAGAVGSLVIVLLLPRVRVGRCRRCDYDFAGITPAAAGKCPECGLDVMLVR